MPMRFPFAILAVLLLALSQLALAEPSPSATEIETAFKAVDAAKVAGPTSIALADKATLKIPQGIFFVPRKEAVALMTAMGNVTGEGFYGLLFGEGFEGFITVSFTGAGYIKDDDARDWNADELLQNLKDGTEAANEERRRRGIPEFIISRWIEAPVYDTSHQRLVWSAELKNKVPVPGDNEPGVNYNTYQLGREGYISMNLVTSLSAVEAGKPVARQLLSGLSFNPGKRYADFDASTDQVAAYGLAALVGGVAAKKLGLLATLGIFLAKFGKIALVAGAAGLAGLAKLFKRKKDEDA